jgi:hypothetical protein
MKEWKKRKEKMMSDDQMGKRKGWKGIQYTEVEEVKGKRIRRTVARELFSVKEKEERRRGIRIGWINERTKQKVHGEVGMYKRNKGKEERNYFVHPP